MTIDARTAAPEPPLHAATLLSRTRLAQRECAARLGISERTLRYHLTGRPMSYALRCLFERLAEQCEANPLYHQRVGRGYRASSCVLLPQARNVSREEAEEFVRQFRQAHPSLGEAMRKHFGDGPVKIAPRDPAIFTEGFNPSKTRRFTGPGELESSGYIDRTEEMRKSVMAISWAEEEQKTLAHLLARIPDGEVRCDPHVLTGLYAMNCRIVSSGYSHAIEALGKPNRNTTPEESKAIQHVLDHGFRRSVRA